jgi:hypothetical protein
MTSGIYRLTFANGDTYIGKSINIDTRWNQHRDKLIKGKAAKAMPQAYELYGHPEGEVLFECHSDHIDLVEACLISRLRPTLNATRPEDPFSRVGEYSFTTVLSYLTQSTLEHVDRIDKLLYGKGEALNLIDTLEKENTNLQRTIERLQKQRNAEEMERDIFNRLKTKDSEIKELRTSINALETREKVLLHRLDEANKSWWQKLFN